MAELLITTLENYQSESAKGKTLTFAKGFLKYLTKTKLVGSITVAQKVRQNSMKDRLKNRFIFQYKNPRDFQGSLTYHFTLKEHVKKL